MLTVDRLELVRDLLIKLVIKRRALSKQRNINLVVLEKLPFFRGVCYFGRKTFGCWAIELCVLSYCHAYIAFSNASQLYRFQGMTYEKDSSD